MCVTVLVYLCDHREELTYEMLILEPRVSDDETPESEASIGTADSSENITMETIGAASNASGVCVFAYIFNLLKENPLKKDCKPTHLSGCKTNKK